MDAGRVATATAKIVALVVALAVAPEAVTIVVMALASMTVRLNLGDSKTALIFPVLSPVTTLLPVL